MTPTLSIVMNAHDTVLKILAKDPDRFPTSRHWAALLDEYAHEAVRRARLEPQFIFELIESDEGARLSVRAENQTDRLLLAIDDHHTDKVPGVREFFRVPASMLKDAIANMEYKE